MLFLRQINSEDDTTRSYPTYLVHRGCPCSKFWFGDAGYYLARGPYENLILDTVIYLNLDELLRS